MVFRKCTGCPTHPWASQDQGSSQKFCWCRNFLYSTYSPPIAIDWCSFSIQLQKTPSKVAFSIPPKMSLTPWRSESRSVNSHPNRSCLMYPKRQKSEGARSGEYGGCWMGNSPHRILLHELQCHCCGLRTGVIGMDLQFSIDSPNLSSASIG
jgi:hypothetical protein